MAKSATFDPRQAMEAYHDAIDKRDLERIRGLLAPEARYVSRGLGDVVGQAAIVDALRRYFDLHPDHRAFDDEMKAVSGSVAWSRWRLTATNRETGVQIRRSGSETVTFDGAGRVLLVESIDD
ncbi:MAG: nuclear transport factor 2 family protein [Hyphomicrobiaceae bacterium]